MSKKVKLVTLGCPKNDVDSEVLGKGIKDAGMEPISDTKNADVIIINTCGFMESAREESIEAILSAAELKEKGKTEEVLVAGCFSQRYQSELRSELPEVDAFFGVEDFRKILIHLGGIHAGAYARPGRRLLSGEKFYAYLKIAEGCDNECSFCSIPLMRGLQKSRSIDSLFEEAGYLAEQGIKELVMVAQDLTTYGWDLRKNGSKESTLTYLIRRLCGIEGIEWIRLMYAHPSHITDELVEVIATESKVCSYLDIPAQHISDRILHSMHRGADGKTIRNVIKRLRRSNPGITLRTSLIAGYPGESESEYKELYDFVEEVEFERLGVFAYSHEEGTPASVLNDDVSEETKLERMDQLMILQQEIALSHNEGMVGHTIKVLVEEKREGSGYYTGRTEKDAPDVDNIVIIDNDVTPGEFVNILVSEASPYELAGSRISESNTHSAVKS